MNSNRKTAGFVGALFLTAMVASLLGGGLVESVISAPNHHLVTAENETLLIVGMLLELVNAIAVVGIATLMFPIMKRHNETMAVGYLGFRLVEAVFCSMIVIAPLSLMTLSREYLKARISDIQFQAAGILAVTERASVANLLILIFFCVGAFLLYSLLYQSKLLPRFISVWGLVAVALVLIINLLSLKMEIGMGISMIFALPIILNEIFMGIWLIVKGFNPSAVNAMV
jgi:hypothetical protein